MLSFEIDYFVNLQSDSIQTFLSVIHKVQNLKIDKAVLSKEFFRTCNVLPFSFVERQGKRPKVHAKQKGSKNFFSSVSKETFDLTVTRWTLWFKSANSIILCRTKASLW